MNRHMQLQAAIETIATQGPRVSMADLSSGPTSADRINNFVPLYNPDEIINFFTVTNALGISTLSKIDMDRTKEHELAHASAAQVVRAKFVGFCGFVFRQPIGANKPRFLLGAVAMVQYNPEQHGNLHRAAVSAYPMDASDSSGDVNGLRAMGYDDVDHVGFEAKRYNERYKGYYIPRPLSYQPNSISYFG